MKIVFVDIDGVLNSHIYYMHKSEQEGNIDKTRLILLKELVDKTGAEIVLSSSWRTNWEKDPERCNPAGKEINDAFNGAGLFIYDKTPEFDGYTERANEVKAWLSEHPDVESFVILDDDGFGWGDLSDNFIKTSAFMGLGLSEEHIRKAEIILNNV